MQVSVVVLTYNPDPKKLIDTLRAIVCQKNIAFEIVLADDGSKDHCFAAAEEFLQSQDFTNYRLVANPENKGTVQNCISGLQAACGQYVYFTSPGDLLFDQNVLADFYHFAQENNCALCFGNAVHYYNGETGIEMTSPFTTPSNPDIYVPHRSPSLQKACYCNKKWITGAAFFREREFALRCFTQIAETSVYTEDTPSTLLAMAEGILPFYYDRNMIWYECGGISTGGNSKWTALINKDIRLSLEKLKKLYPKDPYVDAAWINTCVENRRKRLFCKLLQHPLITLYSLSAKMIKNKPLVCTEADMLRLQQLLSGEIH